VINKEVANKIVQIEVDLMVPEAVSGAGRRAARLPGHGKEVARKARGLEAALIDKSNAIIGALSGVGARTFTVAVAGPAALLVSKLHKMDERLAEGKQDRLDDKDALDILRLRRAIPTATLVEAFLHLLRDPIAQEVTREALGMLERLFSSPRLRGAQMAARAAGPLVGPEQITESCAILATDLLKALLRSQQTSP
jgi:hypothetical protein